MKVTHYLIELEQSTLEKQSCLCSHINLPTGSKILSVYNLDCRKNLIRISVKESTCRQLTNYKFLVFSVNNTIRLKQESNHIATLVDSRSNNNCYYDVFCDSD